MVAPVLLGNLPSQVEVPDRLHSTIQDVINCVCNLIVALVVPYLIVCLYGICWAWVVKPYLNEFFNPTLRLLDEINQRLGLLVSSAYY